MSWHFANALLACMADSSMRFTLRRLFAGITLIAILLAGISIARSGRVGPIHRELHTIVFSPDGASLAIVTVIARDSQVHGKRYFEDVSRTIALLDTATLSNCATVHHEFQKGVPGPLQHLGWEVAFALDGRCIYVLTDAGGQLRTWDIGSRQWLTSRLTDDSGIGNFELSPKGDWLAYSKFYDIEVLNVQTNQPLLPQSKWGGPITFSNDGKRFVVASRNEIQVWDLVQRKCFRRLNENDVDLDPVTCMALSPHGTEFAVRCSDGLRLYDLGTGEKRVLSPEQFEVKQTPRGVETSGRGDEKSRGAAFSPDGTLLAAWGDYGIKFFGASHDFKLQRSVPYSYVNCFAFSPDGKMYATGDRHGKLTLFDTATGNELRSAVLRGGGACAPTLIRSK
jgi:WD40 repeat protein